MKLSQLFMTAGLLSVTSLLQAAPQYSLINLSPLSGYPESYAAAINTQGQIVGLSYAYNYDSVKSLAAMWNNGTASLLPNGQGRYSSASSINDNGLIIGISYTRSGFYELPLGGLESIPSSQPYDGYATLWQNGVAITLPALSGQYAYANGINNTGQIVGWSLDSQNQTVATLWNNNTPTALASLPGYRSEANAINNQGNIVGTLYQGYSGNAVFWDSNNELHLLGTIGGLGGEAFAINDNNLIAGWSQSSDGRQHATLWDNGATIDLGRLDGYASYAYGINNLGQVVGSFIDIDDTTGYLEEYALLWENGNAINLNSLIGDSMGVTLISANGINDQGWIIAQGEDSHGYLGYYLLAPVPEPSTYALLLAGLGLIAGVSQRKSRAINA